MSCDIVVVAALPSPSATAEPGVVAGHATSGGVELAGAKVTWLSQASMSTWAAVLAKPELADDWLPESLGTKRVERLDPAHIYQQNDFQLLGGLVRIQRQAVVAIRWDQVDSARVANCWWVVDPEPRAKDIAAWSNSAEFVTHGQGGWDAKPTAGGVSISYAFWTEAKILLPQVQAWAMSRTLPDLARAFEAHALSVQGGS